jgi:hypothetical protein
MKGLLIKDFTVLLKQLGLFLVIVLVFSAIPDSAFMGYAMIYTAMLPITAIAYDERSKWDELAAMMPYSPMQLVFSKYLLGYILVAAACVVSAIVHIIAAAVTHVPLGSETLSLVVMYLCVAVSMVAVLLPIMFRLGSEKGRFAVIFICIFITVFSVANIEDIMGVVSVGMDGALAFLPAMLAVAVVLNVVSIVISSKFYRKKHS